MRAQVFRVAKEILLKDGWVQGYYGLPNGFCIIGACGQALHKLGLGNGTSDFEFGPDFMALRMAVIEVVDDFNRYDNEVYRWNDAKDRTLDEVLAVLDRAADIAEAG